VKFFYGAQHQPEAESEALVWAARENWRPDWKEDDAMYVVTNKPDTGVPYCGAATLKLREAKVV